jgi:hypothetical protein
MGPELLEEAGRELFGDSWKSALAASIGRDVSTRRRQAKRENVPGPVQAALVAWLVLKRGFGVTPPASPEAPFVSTLTGRELPLEDDGVTDVAASAEKLFGPKWKLPMADALGIDRTSLWRLTSSGRRSRSRLDDDLPLRWDRSALRSRPVPGTSETARRAVLPPQA